MKRIFQLTLLITGLCCQGVFGQRIDSVKFFSDEAALDITITTDIKKLQNESKLDVYQPAAITVVFPDGPTINENITLSARGHFRREMCYIPPLRLNFRNAGSPRLYSLERLKLVIGCGSGRDDEQLVLKEYLIYKMFNILDDKSFRVRLAKTTYSDSKSKVKSFTQYAFFIEDDKDMAKRNGCVMSKQQISSSKLTDRAMLTKVALFEYMISNGDWGIDPTTVHNLKLINDKKSLTAPPFAVPYDFDHSGFVNATYATPAEQLGTSTVTERVYRGYPRTMEELDAAFAVYRDKKAAIISLIDNFTLIKSGERRALVAYIEDFYKIINDKRLVQNIFINNTQLK
jgi:hypothetical protein